VDNMSGSWQLTTSGHWSWSEFRKRLVLALRASSSTQPSSSGSPLFSSRISQEDEEDEDEGVLEVLGMAGVVRVRSHEPRTSSTSSSSSSSTVQQTAGFRALRVFVFLECPTSVRVKVRVYHGRFG